MHIKDDWSYHDYRDVEISTYEMAVKYLLNEGYFVIRMGKTAEKKLNIVEFGAGDIEKNSNTFNLINNNKVNNAIFIEIDEILFNKLEKLKEIYPSIKPINKKVQFEKNHQDTLDNILKKNNVIFNIIFF